MQGLAVGVLLTAMIGQSPAAQSPDGAIDAATFLLAYRNGQADQYKGKTIVGSGLDFNGSAPAIALTVGAADDGPTPAAVTTWEQFRSAQDSRKTLIVMVSAPGFQRTSWPTVGKPPGAYEFRGVFNGAARTLARALSQSDAPDTGACSDMPQNVRVVSGGGGSAARTYHCVPVLENATLQKK